MSIARARYTARRRELGRGAGAGARRDRCRAAGAVRARTRPATPSSRSAAGTAGRPGGCWCSTSAAGRWSWPQAATRTPRWRVSLPLGAGRLTRRRFAGDPPDPRGRRRVAPRTGRGPRAGRRAGSQGWGEYDLAVGTSKTFRSLARLGRGRPVQRRAAGPSQPDRGRAAPGVRVHQPDVLGRSRRARRASAPGARTSSWRAPWWPRRRCARCRSASCRSARGRCAKG